MKFFLILTTISALVFGAQKIDNLVIDGNTVLSADTNGDIILDPNGTGGVQFNDLTATTVPYLDANKELISSAVTPTELGYLSGVTSSIQTQLDSKAASGGFTASRAIESDGSGDLRASSVTSTELGYVSGVTSAIQTQIDGKYSTSGGVLTGDITLDDNNGIAFEEDSVNGTNSIFLKAPSSVTATTILNLPDGAGSADEYLKTDGSGNLSWDTPSGGSSTLSIVSIDNTDSPYSVANTVDILLVDTSGGAVEVDLPASSGNDGESLIIQYTDTGLSNAITIDPNASDTINGSSTTTLNTEGETLKLALNGTNWVTVDRRTPTKSTTYTPTFQGFGTPTSVEVNWSRQGEYIYVHGNFTPSAATGVQARIGLPGSLTIDSSVIDGQGCGQFFAGWQGNVAPFVVLCETGQTYVTVGNDGSSADWFSPLNANGISTTAENGFWFRAPISTWQN